MKISVERYEACAKFMYELESRKEFMPCQEIVKKFNICRTHIYGIKRKLGLKYAVGGLKKPSMKAGVGGMKYKRITICDRNLPSWAKKGMQFSIEHIEDGIILRRKLA